VVLACGQHVVFGDLTLRGGSSDHLAKSRRYRREGGPSGYWRSRLLAVIPKGRAAINGTELLRALRRSSSGCQMAAIHEPPTERPMTVVSSVCTQSRPPATSASSPVRCPLLSLSVEGGRSIMVDDTP